MSKRKLVVYHRSYGCDTGCCGHTVEWFADDVLADPDFSPYYSESAAGEEHFIFSHPYESDEARRLEWAKKFVENVYGEKHVKDLDWEHCIVTDDC